MRKRPERLILYARYGNYLYRRTLDKSYKFNCYCYSLNNNPSDMIRSLFAYFALYHYENRKNPPRYGRQGVRRYGKDYAPHKDTRHYKIN